MADVSAVPFINFGESQARQAEAGASANLTNQQAQGASMQNQIQRASMPLIMKALNDATEDQSGSNPGGAASPGVQAARADQSGLSDVGHNPDSLENTMRGKNYVPPYTPQEMKMLQASKSLSIADPQRGKAMFDMMNANREARMAQQTSQNQLSMGNMYDSATAVATKGKGSFRALEAIDQQDAAAIRKDATDENGQFDEDKADQIATKYATHLGAVSSLYNGRPLKMENGLLVDEKTGQAVTGRDQLFTGLNAEQRQKEWDKAVEPIKWTTPDNVEHQDQRWHAPTEYGGYGGKLTPAQAVLAADQAARHAPDGNAHDPGVIPHAATAGATPMGPATHGATAAARVGLQKNAKPPTTGADIAAGKAPATGTDVGILPGVNPTRLPRLQNPATSQGPGTGGTVGTAAQTGLATRLNKEIEDTRAAGVDAQTMRSQITQARAEIPKIDPRTVGPGSSLYNGALKFYTAAAGNAPNALIDEGVLDKFLNQIGASNVRNLLAGQRITNQEMMTFLTRGSPSTSMPLGGIKHLLDYLDADNEYTLRYNRTKMMGLKSGADPDLIDGALSNDQRGGVSRSRYVASKTGNGPTLGQGPAATQADITEESHGKLKKGDPFYWQGTLHHKGID